MNKFRFKKIDAFTGARSPGNPAGCVWLERPDDITDAQMQQIARELKGFVSEVAFINPEGEGYFLRYWSSEREVDFCGHATIATMFDLFESSDALRGKKETMIRVGNSHLAVQFDQESGVFILAPQPEFIPKQIVRDFLLKPLYLNPIELDERFPAAVVRCGLTALLVPMRKASALADVVPDFENLADFCVKHDIDIVVLHTDDRVLPGSHYRTRVFAPRFGYLEDPATGSGNAALGSWLLHEGLWDGTPLVIEQGRSFKDPNIIRLKTQDVGGVKRVLFGGRATVRIDGWYHLQ